MDEEVVLLEEQLASAHADIERLQLRLADADTRASSHETAAADLKRQLGEAQNVLAEREAALAGQAQEIASLAESAGAAEARARATAQRYREAALSREPDLPADLVAGESVEEIDQSLSKARETVAQVRQHLEQQAKAVRVPAGAPARTEPDLSALTPAEKIRLGISRT